ncbi:MAG: KamA family radical SAM protein [Proteobacteria bacterium]|nr:KamA family radical SAM protein [Pseudomonadota bacterium]
MSSPAGNLLKIDFKKVDWQEELSNNVTTLDELNEFLPLSGEEQKSLEEVVERHPMNIPRYYLSLIDPNDPEDPIRKLAMPSADELVVAGSMGETTQDPYGDDKHDKGNGILHKYPYSALIVATEYCAMYCRHCFRKRMVGLPNKQTVESFNNAAKYIAEHKEITNVILSGGDPLMLPTPILKQMLDTLRDIDHINYIRIATRVPVVFPMRLFDKELLSYLKEFNREKAVYVPTHFNHNREITSVATDAVQALREAGITVNNQAVFLRGVNDSPDALEDLMNGLVRIGVNPYYLYQCMPVSRVRHHFQVPLKEGIDIVNEAKSRLDGYAKRFKFIMGHDIGKIEICGRDGNKLVMNQIHSRPDHPEEASKVLIRELTDNAGWFDDLPE